MTAHLAKPCDVRAIFLYHKHQFDLFSKMIERASNTTGESIAWMMILLQKKTQKETCFPEMSGFPHQSKKGEYISFAEVTNNFNKVQIALLVSCTFVGEKYICTVKIHQYLFRAFA